ncbi:UNVERIFIED_CONTAM: hypothetical protein FKN15_024428 [Acipenser sinensis]
MVAACVGAPTTQRMDFKELIEMINRNTAAQIEQTKKWRQEWGLPDPELTELDLLLQKWEQTRDAPLTPVPEPRGEEPPFPEPRGEEPPLPEPRGEEPPLPEPRGEEPPLPEPRGEEGRSIPPPQPRPPHLQSSSALLRRPSTFAPGHPAGLPRPPCAGPGAQESAALATALPLVPCSALPEHPDVAGLLPDVAIAPPVRCFAPPG